MVAEYPGDWLEGGGAEPASDLDLVVLLVNSLDLLADPPDRLTDLRWFRAVLNDVGHAPLARSLRPGDLAPLRVLRDALRGVFEAASAADAAARLNPLLSRAPAVPQLVVEGPRIELRISPDERGLRALSARLPAALAAHVAQEGIARLGTCSAGPCTCAFIDRTRARTRRYCCTLCNDRAAARGYRERHRRS